MSDETGPNSADSAAGDLDVARRALRARATKAERRGLGALDGGDFDEAVESLLVAVAAFESLGDSQNTNAAANYLGVALAERGETVRAMRVWEEIIDRGWDSPTAYNCLIRHYRREEDRSKIHQLYKRLEQAAYEHTGNFFAVTAPPFTSGSGDAGPDASSDVPRVLIADDEPSMLKLMERVLEPGGYEILSARDGAEALDIVLNAHPDVIVLDIIMPRHSGLDVLYRMRAEGIDTPVIVTSGRAAAQMVLDAQALQAKYLSKPFKVEVLAELVRRGARARLNRRRARR